jgi:hypothetical protein
LLVVRFDENSHWRRNDFLIGGALALGFKVQDLPAEPILIGGEFFDPIEHFKKARTRDRNTKTSLKFAALEGLRAALATVPEGNGRWQAIADKLNGDAIRTGSRKSWTAENVRKQAIGLDQISAPGK